MLEDIKAFLKSFTEKFRSKKISISPFVFAVCALLVVIPTVLAIYYAYFYEDTSYLATNYVEVQLYGGDGRLLASENVTEANVPDSELVSVIYGIHKNKSEIQTPAELPDKNFEFWITEKGALKKYSCYFSDSSKNSYVTVNNETYYIIEENSFNDFLNSKYSERLYASAQPPQLSTGNGELVTPFNVKWNYKKQNKSFCKATECEVITERKTYTISGSVNLSFDLPYDEANIILYDTNGGELYNGPLEYVSYAIIPTGSQIRARLTASWDSKDGIDKYGEIIYDFNILLKDRAIFNISASDITEGEFVMLSATNIDDISKIMFSITHVGDTTITTEESAALNKLLSLKPKFIKENNVIRTIIPFPIDSPKGSYRISVAFGAAEQIFTVSVNKRISADATVDISSSDISSRISKDALNSLNQALKIPSASSPDIFLAKRKFLSPEELGFNVGYSYNDNVSSNDKKITFSSKGIEYLADIPGGKAVPSLNIGTVVTVGECSYLGKYVAVDHGLGLRTWYCGLDSVTVSVGHTVAQGETVGTCGTTGLSSSSGVLILCSVYEILIDPTSVLGKNILAVDP